MKLPEKATKDDHASEDQTSGPYTTTAEFFNSKHLQC